MRTPFTQINTSSQLSRIAGLQGWVQNAAGLKKRSEQRGVGFRKEHFGLKIHCVDECKE